MLLSEVVGEVRRETGAWVRTDESLANDKAVVLVHSRPAWEILDKVAETFRLEWVQEGPFWVLRRSPEQAKLEAKLKRKQEDDAARRVKDRIMAMRPYLSLTIPQAEARLHEVEKGQGKDFVEVYWNVIKKFPGVGDSTDMLNRIVAWALLDAKPEEWRLIGRGGTWVGSYPQAPGTYPLAKEVRDFFCSPGFREDTKFAKSPPTSFVLTMRLDRNQEVQMEWALANRDGFEKSRLGGGALTPYLFDWPIEKDPEVLKLKAWSTPLSQMEKEFKGFKEEMRSAQPWRPIGDPWVAAFDAGGPNVIASWFRIDDWPNLGLDLPNLVSHGFTRHEDSYLLALKNEYWLYGAVEPDERMARSLEREDLSLERILQAAATYDPDKAEAYDSFLYYRGVEYGDSPVERVAHAVPVAKLFASMSMEQKRKAMEPEGLGFLELSPAQQKQAGPLVMRWVARFGGEEEGPILGDSRQWDKLRVRITQSTETVFYAKFGSYFERFDRPEQGRAWLQYENLDPHTPLYRAVAHTWAFEIGAKPWAGYRQTIGWVTHEEPL